MARSDTDAGLGDGGSDRRDPCAAFRLDGRTALVTGASSGLGRRFTEVLVGAGARVVATARRADRLAELADAHPGAVVPVAADLAVAAERERVAAEAEAHGPVDIVVNNAGVADPRPIEQESLEDFERIIGLNLTAAWHLAKLVGTGMAARGSGVVVNVASILGMVGATPMKQAGYTAAKGALVNLTRELALQWARKGVRVNALCPGWFRTEMTAGLGEDERSAAWIGTNTPIPRMGEPHELDGPLLLLASDASSFMTGSLLVVDGGWTAR